MARMPFIYFLHARDPLIDARNLLGLEVEKNYGLWHPHDT
jgi:hypothetical protein